MWKRQLPIAIKTNCIWCSPKSCGYGPNSFLHQGLHLIVILRHHFWYANRLSLNFYLEKSFFKKRANVLYYHVSPVFPAMHLLYKLIKLTTLKPFSNIKHWEKLWISPLLIMWKYYFVEDVNIKLLYGENKIEVREWQARCT